MKNQTSQHLSAVYTDLMNLTNKIQGELTLSELMNLFYDIMRKHGIKHGTITENGSVTCINAEWNICYTTFVENVVRFYFTWENMLNTPKDLEY